MEISELKVFITYIEIPNLLWLACPEIQMQVINQTPGFSYIKRNVIIN